jgi:hypothetical protein
MKGLTSVHNDIDDCPSSLLSIAIFIRLGYYHIYFAMLSPPFPLLVLLHYCRSLNSFDWDTIIYISSCCLLHFLY